MSTTSAANQVRCPDPATLAKLLRDELGPTEVGSVEEHVGACPGCQKVLDGLVGSLPGVLSPTGPYAWGADDEPPTVPGYELLGRIDAGGMGVVWRARDLEFGRDLAVKVMASRGRASPRQVERFLAEAQICARLTHPFIVPVHAMGRLADGRPYYTMKLVEGRTLAALLEGGPAPTERRMEFVQVFDRVCQALAFAHGRGVIHRDLKPENVMVGAHGEVQLMDWGLAKVLADSHPEGAESEGAEPADGTRTRTGSVLGTAAYMAPEQAQGRVEEVDRRSDVFGLGATLCRILTGEPPYTGPDGETVRRRAAEADLWETLVRLHGCGADPELIHLAVHCLARRKADRPADAGAVAARLAAYQAGAQDRLRQAELERAAAQAAAAAERTARRRTRALAVTVLALVASAAGGGLWAQHQAAQRQAEQARREGILRQEVIANLDQAIRFRQSGHFDASRELLEQSRQRLDDGGPDDLRPRVEQCLADTTLARRLDDARHRAFSWGESKRDLPGAERGYAEALAEAGLGREGDDPAAVGARVRASAVREHVLAALDDWAGVTSDEARRGWLLAVARAIDPDPDRDRLRRPELWRDPKALLEVSRQPEAAHLLPHLAIALARPLLGRRDGSAVPLLYRAQQQRPNDFWINAMLGAALADSKHPDQALNFYRVALALRPESGRLHLEMAAALYSRRQFDEAIGHYEEALRLRPGAIPVRLSLGKTLTRKGRLEAALRQFEEAVRLEPGSSVTHSALADALVRTGQVEAAIRHYQEALHLRPQDVHAHCRLGMLLYKRGQRDAALRHYEEALRIDPGHIEALHHLGEALYDDGGVDAIVRHYEALRIDPRSVAAHCGLGDVLLDRGEGEAALRHYEEAVRIDRRHAGAHFHLGLGLLRQGRFSEALERLLMGDALRGNRWYQDYPLDHWIERARSLMNADRKLSALPRGGPAPIEASERLDLAEVCKIRKRYAAAARYAADAFAAQPPLAEDLHAGHLDRAVCAAALAGCGRGQDAAGLSDTEKARLRRQARDWLAAGLARQLTRDRHADEDALRRWLKDPELACVRDPEVLAQLPQEERQQWLSLWQQVQRLLTAVGAGHS